MRRIGWAAEVQTENNLVVFVCRQNRTYFHLASAFLVFGPKNVPCISDFILFNLLLTITEDSLLVIFLKLDSEKVSIICASVYLHLFYLQLLPSVKKACTFVHIWILTQKWLHSFLRLLCLNIFYSLVLFLMNYAWSAYFEISSFELQLRNGLIILYL